MTNITVSTEKNIYGQGNFIQAKLTVKNAHEIGIDWDGSFEVLKTSTNLYLVNAFDKNGQATSVRNETTYFEMMEFGKEYFKNNM